MRPCLDGPSSKALLTTRPMPNKDQTPSGAAGTSIFACPVSNCSILAMLRPNPTKERLVHVDEPLLNRQRTFVKLAQPGVDYPTIEVPAALGGPRGALVPDRRYFRHRRGRQDVRRRGVVQARPLLSFCLVYSYSLCCACLPTECLIVLNNWVVWERVVMYVRSVDTSARQRLPNTTAS